MSEELNAILQARRDKLAELTSNGKNPYAVTSFDKQNEINDIVENFDTYEGKPVVIAGRLMSKRGMGKASFADVQDENGKIQLYVSRDNLGEEAYDEFKKLDIGDIIGVSGEVFLTHKEEKSVRATKVTLLSKSLRPLPEKFHGLKDTDLRYRERYVDLIVNPEVKETFVKRFKVIKTIRDFLDNKGYIEFETPVLSTISGGATARPFTTHHKTLNLDMYLRIATELHLKRLVVGGFEKVYEIGRLFRNEGMSTRHNPEFTTIEIYTAYEDYASGMDLTENIIRECAKAACGTTKIKYEETDLNFDKFEKISMIDIVKRKTGIDFDGLDDIKAVAAAKKLGIEIKGVATWGEVLNIVFEEKCEKALVQPTFVYDYPVEVSPLAKKKADDARLTERFELFVYGRELANAYSELNDPIDQNERFK
ncbi:lysine--tRNA ligase, partial [Treponema sp. R6D11]